jgi:predicted amino acid racemase
MPILPEHRILVNMQRAIEDEFGIRLDGTGDGNSCSIELIKAVIEDVLYNLRTGELVVDAEGKVVTARGEKPQIQFKMDACRAMSKIKYSRPRSGTRFPMYPRPRTRPTVRLKCAFSKMTTTGTMFRLTLS